MKTSPKGRKHVSFKDLQIAYLKNGIGSISKSYQERKTTKIAILKALEGLKKTDTEVASFEQWVVENLKTKPRGRAAPPAGSERVYKAQQINRTGPFLRLPLNSLNVEKGQLASVIFEKDQIIVQKKRDTATTTIVHP